MTLFSHNNSATYQPKQLRAGSGWTASDKRERAGKAPGGCLSFDGRLIVAGAVQLGLRNGGNDELGISQRL
jgi:hypothetical protein